MEGIVMKNIQERAKEWGEHIVETTPYDIVNDKLCVFDEDRDIADVAEESYIAGATDQKAIEEEVTLKKYDTMTGKQLDREENFASWYFQNVKGVPTFSDAIEWSRKQTIDEVCEWFKTNVKWMSNQLMSILMYELRKAMEE